MDHRPLCEGLENLKSRFMPGFLMKGALMANYVYQQVICSESFLNQYFIDKYPFGENEPTDSPYITFNQIMEVSDLGQYSEEFDYHICYGYGFSYRKTSDEHYLVKFATRWNYPYPAIHRAIEIDHTLKWYAVEENFLYASLFYWDGGVKESICMLASEVFDNWVENHYKLDESLSDEDSIVWYYLQDNELEWIDWQDSLNLPRYNEK